MTGLILKIEGIKDALSIEFYIERDKSIKIRKEDLIKVFRGNDVEYYAPVDTNRLGRGHLMARVEFADKEIMYPEGIRPVVVSGFTGYTIPCMGEGNSISCGGYTVSFEKVSDIPKNDAMIYYGVTDDSFDRLDLRQLSATKNPIYAELNVVPGNRVVVLVPYDWEYTAAKDNGFGGKVPFSTTIQGYNGEVFRHDDGMKYKTYGELMAVEGKIKIYIE
jgi:hypothetical protein